MSRYSWLLGPAIVGVTVLTSLTGAVALVHHAHSDPSFAIEEDYYDKAVRWDESAAERRKSEALGWSVAVSVARGGESARIELVDRGGSPVEGAAVSVEAFHNARASDVRRVEAAPAAGGVYEMAGDFTRPGAWEFRIRAARGPDVFVAKVRANVAQPEGVTR